MLCLDLMYLHYFKNYSGLVCVKRKQSYCKLAQANESCAQKIATHGPRVVTGVPQVASRVPQVASWVPIVTPWAP